MKSHVKQLYVVHINLNKYFYFKLNIYLHGAYKKADTKFLNLKEI